MKTIQEVREWLQRLLKFGMKPGLERMEWLLEKLNHPERRLKTIHVAGTNGKGSTIAYMTQMLMNAEQEIGTFTSPHVSEITDRIAVNDEPISDEDFIEVANRIRPLVEELEMTTDYGQATEFEVMTAIALEYFAKVAYPDIVIVEAGLGGRLDSTNVIHPLLTIITNISFDHTDILGDTIESIASEKAGIIKSGVPVITGATGKALQIIENTAKEKRAKCYRYGHEFSSNNEVSQPDGEQFDFQSPFLTKNSMFIAMKGSHQVENASLALMALDYLYFFFGLTVELEDLKAGLKSASIKGRFEEVSEQPVIILDGAHNERATERLAETIATRFPNHNIHVIFAALGTKDVKQMLTHVEKVSNQLTLTTFSHPKALKADELEPYVSVEHYAINSNLKELIHELQNNCDDSTVYVITGSLYFISEVRHLLQS